jgi:ribosomal protein S18 acetylase RimI-like enzyme
VELPNCRLRRCMVSRKGGAALLDKSLPYFSVIMKRRANAPIPNYELPPGYSFRSFCPGDQAVWADIETSVGEFSTPEDALHYFQSAYLATDAESLGARLVFACDSHGKPVGTATSWWNDTNGRRNPALHWLAVRSEHQGMGLGKALVSESLRRLVQLEGHGDVFLHSQTWSHRAIAIYLKAGFTIVAEESFADYPNDYRQAIAILRTVVPNLPL